MDHNHAAQDNAELCQIVESYKSLLDERRLLDVRMKEFLSRVKEQGYDHKAIAHVIKLQRGGVTDWAALHARGLTAKQAAKEAGKTVSLAYTWASYNGVKWAKPSKQKLDHQGAVAAYKAALGMG